MTASRRPGLRELMPPHRIVISLILAVAVGLLWLGFTESRDGGTVVRPTRPAVVTRVFPVEHGLGLRQEPIGFELAVGYTGELQVDGRDIPLDQLVRPQPPAPNDNAPANRGLAGLNQFSFSSCSPRAPQFPVAKIPTSRRYLPRYRSLPGS